MSKPLLDSTSDDTTLQDERVLVPGATAHPTLLGQVEALAAQEDQAARALSPAEVIAATPVAQTVRGVRRVKRCSADLEL